MSLKIKFKNLFEKWELTSLKLNTQFLEAEFEPSTEDRDAAWEMYVELITRIVTQRLDIEHGDEKTALDSVYSLFATTRVILKEKGRKAGAFTKIAVIILNQIVRPFTAKWHKLSLAGAFVDAEKCKEFREELAILQDELRKYAKLLADLACVEDITEINDIIE